MSVVLMRIHHEEIVAGRNCLGRWLEHGHVIVLMIPEVAP